MNFMKCFRCGEPTDLKWSGDEAEYSVSSGFDCRYFCSQACLLRIIHIWEREQARPWREGGSPPAGTPVYVDQRCVGTVQYRADGSLYLVPGIRVAYDKSLFEFIRKGWFKW